MASNCTPCDLPNNPASSATPPETGTTFVHVTGPPDNWTKERIVAHVKTAMLIELSTIPIYLCAAASIKHEEGNEWSARARLDILGVAQQEMLHLALAGNILASLDASQPLYNHCFMPRFPSKILFDEISMELRPANKENLENFLKIEAPYSPPVPTKKQKSMVAQAPPKIASTYHSIGDFYHKLELGIQIAADIAAQHNLNLFQGTIYPQFQGLDFFDSDMTVVKDKVSALKAIKTIIDQGEGGTGKPDSHYTAFVELHQMRTRWKCIDYVDGPSTQKYKDKGDNVAEFLSLAVNASYCFLLRAIDRFREPAMTDRPLLLRQIRRIMVAVLAPLMEILVRQKLADGKFAAPCFEYYPPRKQDDQNCETRCERQCLSPDLLLGGLRNELKQAHDAAQDLEVKGEIAKIIFSTEGLSLPLSSE